MDEEPYERPKAKKLLKIINTASGHFIEEPMTPEHPNKHGFQGNLMHFNFGKWKNLSKLIEFGTNFSNSTDTGKSIIRSAKACNK